MSLEFTLGDIISALVLVILVATFFYNKNVYDKKIDTKILTSQAVQEKENEVFTKDIKENKEAIKGNKESENEYKKETNKKLSRIFEIITKSSTEIESIMKKLDI